MTHNQINFYKERESKRAHLASEALQSEANAIGWRNADIAQQNANTNAMNASTNLLSVEESIRHNKATEENQKYSNQTARTDTIWSNSIGTVKSGVIGTAATAATVAGAKVAKASGNLGGIVSSLAGSPGMAASTLAGTLVHMPSMQAATSRSAVIRKEDLNNVLH